MRSFRGYVIGFGASLALTLAAFYAIWQYADRLPEGTLVAIIVGLALVQLAVQLVYFLHLGSQSKPRWNLIVASFALLVVLIVVLGSLWIMQNLNYHMQPRDVETYIIKDEGFRR